MSETSDESDTDWVRINISLAPRHRSLFDELAEQHYGGNVSRLVRAAVYTEKEQLEGMDTIELKKMRSAIQSIEDQLSDLDRRLDEIDSAIQGLQAGVDSTTATANTITNRDDAVDLHQIKQRILSIVDDHERPPTMAHINAATEFELSPVHRALQELIDDGMIEDLDKDADTVRYTLTSPQADNND